MEQRTTILDPIPPEDQRTAWMLRLARECGVRDQDIAREMGVTPRAVRAWRTGARHPKAGTKRALFTVIQELSEEKVA
ncbi:MAG: helix-turn-helix domain-containing protein [Actinomycetota bacterium]